MGVYMFKTYLKHVHQWKLRAWNEKKAKAGVRKSFLKEIPSDCGKLMN
jgi:hypothetical protein